MHNANPIFHLKEKDSLIKMGFWKKFLKIFGIIVLILIILSTIAFFFLPIKISQNGFEIGKSSILCYSKVNSIDTKLNCTTDKQCVDEYFAVNGNNTMNDMNQLYEQIIFCQGTCKAKQTRWLNDTATDSCSSIDEGIVIVELTPYKLLKIFQQMNQTAQ